MHSYLEQLRRELDEATGSADAGEATQPGEGKWTPAQIIEHLLLTYKGTNAGLAKCLAGNAPLARQITLKDRVGIVLVVDLGYLPNGRKAPVSTTPRGLPFQEARTAMFSELEKMALGLDDCERRFGARTRILDHPILGPLTANQWRKFHLVHGCHHARQIRERMGAS
jgi:DinB superfamily